MARTHGDTGEVQPLHQFANRALVQRHAKVPINLVAQIHQPPAHHLVLLQAWALPHPLRHRRFLLGGKLARRRARVRLVVQAIQAGLVVPMHPVAQRLPVHAACPRRFGAVAAVQHQRQCQHPAGCRHVLAPRRRHTQARRIQLRPCDRDRHLRPPAFIGSESHPVEPLQITSESTRTAAGINRT